MRLLTLKISRMIITGYSLSIHMALQILLILVGGPFIVATLPERWTRSPGIYRLSKFLFRHVWLGWLAGVATMCFWHIPVIYHWAMMMVKGNEWFVSLHVLTLLVAGTLFAWPLIGPYPGFRISTLSGIVYLATACVSCSFMGLLIAFAPMGLYSGVSQEDLQTAGRIMWVPGCLIFVFGCLLLSRR